MSYVFLYMSDAKKQSDKVYPFEWASTAELLVSTDKSALLESFAGLYVSVRKDRNIYYFAIGRDSHEVQININLLRNQYLPVTP